MQNGKVNGTAPQTMQVNPQQAAAFGLQFLERAPHTRAEREQFDMAQAMLNAIATGQVVLAPVTNEPAAEPPAQLSEAQS